MLTPNWNGWGRGKILIAATACLVAFLSVGSVYAQTVDPTAFETLQKQMGSLLTEIQNLKTQVQTLQTRLDTLSTSTPPPASLVSPPPDAPASSPSAAAGPAAPALTRSLARGDQGEDVRALQKFMAQDPGIYPDGLITGFFGTATQAALARWQTKYGLDATGSVGPLTLAKIKAWGQTPPAPPSAVQPPPAPAASPQPSTNPVAPTEICPSLPTVSSCAFWEEKTVTYRSAKCGVYYTCTPRGQIRNENDAVRVFPYSFSSGAVVNSWEEAVAYCKLINPATVQGILQECTNKFSADSTADYRTGQTSANQSVPPACPSGQFWNGTACANSSISTTPPAGQREQAWNSLGLRSWIRSDADPGRIANLKLSCQNTPGNANVWLSSAGNFGSVDFGMPSPDKCGLASSCSSTQYFDGSRCTTATSGTPSWITSSSTGTGSGYSFAGDANSCPGFAYSRWDSTGTRYCRLNNEARCAFGYPKYLTEANYTTTECPAGDTGSTWGSSATTCTSDLIALLGSGCHNMGSAWFNSGMTQYVPLGTATVKNCSTENFSGCGGSGSTYTSCPSGQYWNGSSCVSSSGGGTTSGSYPTCTSGQYWNGSSCVTSTTGGSYSSDPATACTQAGGTWNSATQYCSMPSSGGSNYGGCEAYASQGSCTSVTNCYWYSDSASSYCYYSSTPPSSALPVGNNLADIQSALRNLQETLLKLFAF